MGSLDTSPVIGQYMHPVIDENTRNDDPWKRSYYAPPAMKSLVPRSYPLKDARPLMADASTAEMLKSHGFGVAKQDSAFLHQLDGEITEQAMVDKYHPEMEKIVLEVTGAKSMFVLASVLRRGKEQAEAYKLPAQVSTAKSAATGGTSSKDEGVAIVDKTAQAGKPPPILGLASPVRVPHMDFTPLGARQTIRSLSQDVHKAATESGIITVEDDICASRACEATRKDSDQIIAEYYNGSKLGPRYAAYSIWRPLKKVQRDPITLAPTTKPMIHDEEHVSWRYENRIPGTPELGGDYLKEYAMLGVKGKQVLANRTPLDWYYLPGQESNEVLFIKLFDSAALGSKSDHAGAPWHASPEIGSAVGSEARESIELRVLVFW